MPLQAPTLLLIPFILQPFFSAVGEVWEARPGSNGAGVSRSTGVFFRSDGPDKGQEPPPHQEDVVWVTHRGDERIHPKRYNGDLRTRLDSFRSAVLWRSLFTRSFRCLCWHGDFPFDPDIHLNGTTLMSMKRDPLCDELALSSNPPGTQSSNKCVSPPHQPKPPSMPRNAKTVTHSRRAPYLSRTQPSMSHSSGPKPSSSAFSRPTYQLLLYQCASCVVARCHVSFSLTAGCCSAV